MIHVLKNLLFLLLLFIPISSYSQTIVDYFEFNGLETVAKLAHFNTKFIKESSSFQIFPQGIILDLHYEFGYRTMLFVRTENGYFTNVKVVKDSHWFPAFDMVSTLEAMENTNTENVEDPIQKSVRKYYESQWNKPTNAFSKEELCTSLLFYSWINFVHLKKKEFAQTNHQEFQEIKEEVIVKVDGVKIVGNKTFQKRVAGALSYIKEYVPKIYNDYFVNGPGHYGLVKEIHLNKSAKNTIMADGIILVGKDRGNKYEWSTEVGLAVLLIHEMKHLLQHEDFAMEEQLGISFEDYKKFHFGEYPRAVATKEIEAYKYTLQFLNKLDRSNKHKSFNTNHVNKMVNIYGVLSEASDLLEDPDTVSKGCEKIDLFISLVGPEVKKQGRFFKNAHCR